MRVLRALQEEASRLPPPPPGQPRPPVRTWIHELFQGTLVNQTRCLWCETVTSRDESFLDLSIDIEQNSSITACLRNFSSVEAGRLAPPTHPIHDASHGPLFASPRAVLRLELSLGEVR